MAAQLLRIALITIAVKMRESKISNWFSRDYFISVLLHGQPTELVDMQFHLLAIGYGLRQLLQ